LSHDIERSLFSSGRQNYLHEVDLANSRLDILGHEKSFSHTKSENRRRNYQRLVKGRKSCRDDSLVLLADLDVSRIYRDSLNLDFYNSKDSFGGMFFNRTFFSSNIIERMHGEYREDEVVEIELLNEILCHGDKEIGESEEMIFASGSKQEVMSLLLSLILNVKEKGRGIENCGEESRKIQVYLSKTPDGRLRIMNETNYDELELKKIQYCLKKEPKNEESGITLWALNACINRAFVCYVREGLAKGENCQNFLSLLTRGELDIKLNIKKEGSKKFFSYELPVFRELYERKEK